MPPCQAVKFDEGIFAVVSVIGPASGAFDLTIEVERLTVLDSTKINGIEAVLRRIFISTKLSNRIGHLQ